jgi:hypothetical protein
MLVGCFNQLIVFYHAIKNTFKTLAQVGHWIELSYDIAADELSNYGVETVNPIFIKVRIQSRHVNKTRYYVYI